jgi:Matrixin
MTVRGKVGPLLLGGALATAALWAPKAHAYTVKQTSSGATVRWFVNSVSMRIDPSMQSYFKDLPVNEIVGDATSAWHGLSGVPELLLNEGEPGPAGFQTGRGDKGNGVYLVEDWDLQENALAVTVATFETNSGKIVDADVLVNPNHPLVLLPDGPDSRADGFDLRGVLTHEMGHVLGLGEAYGVNAATMFPSVAPGETHQRDIDVDDEQGVEEAYAQAIPSETEAQGCSGSSVIVRRGHKQGAAFWLTIGVVMIAAGLWLRTRKKDGKRAALPVLALVMLFGGDTGDVPLGNERVEVLRTLALRRMPAAERHQGIMQATRSSSVRVRLAAIAVLEKVGSREDVDVAARLTLDSDAEVRRVAYQAIESLRTAPPAARVGASDEKAQKRLHALFGGARRVVKGEAVSVGVQDRRGLLWSRYLVHGEDDVVEVQIPGGSAGGITQIVSEQEPPADGDSVIVAVQDKGPHAWAHLRDGVIYGGHLGDGPGIQLDQ